MMMLSYSTKIVSCEDVILLAAIATVPIELAAISELPIAFAVTATLPIEFADISAGIGRLRYALCRFALR